MGFIFQDYNLIPELNVGDNIGLALQFKGSKNNSEKIAEVLKRVELEGYETRKVTELSGGQKQRVAIARSIVKEPEIIFADEPTGALDQETGASILGILKELSRDRLVITVTHDREFAEEYGDRIIELSDGRIKSDTCGDYKEIAEEKISDLPRPAMPAKAAVKIGCSNFRYHPVRLAATIFLSVIAFTLLAVALTGAFNKRSAIVYNAFVSGGLTHSAVAKHNAFTDSRIPVKQSEKESLEEVLGVGVLAVVENEIEIENLAEPEEYTPFNSIMPAGFTSITDEQLAEYGFTLTGRLPAEEDEAAITAFTAEIFKERGFSDGGMSLRDNGLIGAKPVINGKEYTVTGIVDTRLDVILYAKLREAAGADEEINSSAEKLADELYCGAHNLLFVSAPEKFAEAGEISLRYARLRSGQSVNAAEVPVDSVNLFDENAGYACYATKADVSVKDRVYLPANLIPDFIVGLACNAEFNGKTYTDFGELFLAEYNDRGGGDAGYAERQKIYMDIYEKYEDTLPVSFDVKFAEMSYGFEAGLEVNGFFADDSSVCRLLLGENIYNRVFAEIGGEYSRLIVPLGVGAKHNLQKLADGVEVGEFDFTFDNFIFDGVKKSDGTISTVKKVCASLSAVFVVFSAVLLLNFMSLSVSDKTETVGILKAMGCNNGNLYKVFIIESVIIGLSVSALSVGLGAAVCAAADGVIRAMLGLGGLSVFKFNGAANAVLCAACMLFSLSGAVMPLINISRKKPIDYINRIN